jgi:outer membrane protein OmpA-like peptidoglycan-associated protein
LSGTTAASSPPPSSAADASAKSGEEPLNLFSAPVGAFIEPLPEGDTFGAWALLDGDPKTNWTTQGSQQIVIALPQRATIRELAYMGGSVSLKAEVSDDAKSYRPAGEFALAEPGKNTSGGDAQMQSHRFAQPVTGRFVRMTLQSSADYTNNNELQARGEWSGGPPQAPDISGTYRTAGFGDLQVRRNGIAVDACIGTSEVFSGNVEGAIARGWWKRLEDGSATEVITEGPAMLSLSPDGEGIAFFFWNKGSDTMFSQGRRRTSSEFGACPQWAEQKGSPEEALAQELQSSGRLRVYGIQFDSDSAQIKPESKPVLDQLVRMLAAQPDWNVTIEGHTDSTSTPEHNQKLSEQRAEAVRSYFGAAGIPTPRMQASGAGSGSPVAPNDTALGRAQNRRVEIVKR